MSNPSADKGARAERELVRWLRDVRGFDAERIRSGRSTDPGDITWPGSLQHVDVKHQRRWALPAWWAEMEAEVVGTPLRPLLVLRRERVTDPGRWLAVQWLEDAL